MRRIAILALSAPLSLAACEDTVVDRLPEPEVHIDVLKQKPAALVDILWVVDNSGSMADEQEALAGNFDRFITGLATSQCTDVANDVCDFTSKTCQMSGAPCNPPDYHIGVIATDVEAATDKGRLRKVGLCVPSLGAMPNGMKFRYCGVGGNSDCVHDMADPNSDATNRICDFSNNDAVTFVTPTTPNITGAFARAVNVGVGGAALEEGIRAAAMALGRDTNKATGQWIPAPDENRNFLRSDASLFIIFVSDEEDGTFGETPYFYRAFETLKGAGNEGAVSVSAIVGDPDVDGEGPIPGGCPAPPAEAIAVPGDRYIGLSMYSRGLSSELRVCDERRLTCARDVQACERPIETLPGVCKPTAPCTVDQDCGNFTCRDGNRCMRCVDNACSLPPDRFLDLLGQTGIYGSICSAYDQVLGKLGFEAAGLARKFQLTENPDCTEDVKCCPEGTADEACTTLVRVCVKVNGVPIANERSMGWVYEQSTNSIFFDGTFVPPTDAAINVSYKLSTADAPLSCTTALK